MNQADGQDPNETRIVLIGKTGVGKSATGNTILGRKAFESESSPSSVTSECHKEGGDVGGRKVAVIDTPGLFDTTLSKEEVLKKIKMCISLSAPGPHVFLVVLQLGRLTEEEKKTIEMIQTTFGQDAAKYTMVLFTRGDDLEEDQTIESFVSKSPGLKAFTEKCHDRYHVFNNKNKNPEQTRQLLDKIDQMTGDNGGSFYTNDMFMRAEEAIKKEEQRLLEEWRQNRVQEAKKEEGQRLLVEWRPNRQLEADCQEEIRIMLPHFRARAERSNEFLHSIVHLSTGCGAAVGDYIGARGLPTSAIVGAAVGAAIAAASVRVSQRCTIQ